MKKIVEKELASRDVTLFDGTIDDVIANLQNIKKEYPQYPEIRVGIRAEGQDCYPEVEFFGKRLETDKEYHQRINRQAIAKKAAKARKERELQEAKETVAELKAKYGSALEA